MSFYHSGISIPTIQFSLRSTKSFDKRDAMFALNKSTPKFK